MTVHTRTYVGMAMGKLCESVHACARVGRRCVSQHVYMIGTASMRVRIKHERVAMTGRMHAALQVAVFGHVRGGSWRSWQGG